MWKGLKFSKINKEVLRLPELHRASALGLYSDVRFMIKCGFDVDQVSSDGLTPLHCACAAGQVEVTNVLLEHSQDPEGLDRDGNHCIHLAVKAGSVPILKKLVLYKPRLELTNRTGMTPLQVAADIGNAEAVHVLLNAGAKVDARSIHTGRSALELAALKGHTVTIQQFLSFGVRLGCALHLAAGAGHLAAVGLLLDAGADINASDDNGERPLHLAIVGGHREVVELLLTRDANFDLEGSEGCRAIHMAVKWPELLRLLLERGVSPNATDNAGATPLDWAQASSQTESAAILRDAGAISKTELKNSESFMIAEDMVSGWLQTFPP